MSGAKSVAFMQKKSWHTGTMQHMEKVWIAEQKAVEEAKKLDKVRKELAEEREIEDLRRQHENATGKKRLDRVDFLYQTPLSAGGDADEYLLGKKFQEDKKQTDIHTVASKPGSLYLNNPMDVLNDTRNKVLEDPLFAIKQQEVKAKKSVMENPIKMKKLRDEVMMEKLRKEFKKKDKKRAREEDVKDEERAVKRLRSRSTSPQRAPIKHEREPHRDEVRERPSGRTEGGDESRRRAPSPPRRRSISPPRRRSRSPPRRRSRSPPRRERSPPRRDYTRRSRSRSPPRRRSRSPLRRERSPPRRDERKDERPSTSTSSRKSMTDEERQRRLQEMEANAREHEQDRMKLLNLAKENDKAEQDDEKNKAVKGEALAPNFLSDMSKSVYSDSKTGTVEDRVKRARFSSQRTNLDERGFL